MGCGCGKKASAGPRPARFEYSAPDGTKTPVASEVEARLKVARGGGTYAPIAK